MCDFLPGRLIVSHHHDDAAARALVSDIRERRLEHVTYVSSMRDRLRSRGVTLTEDFAFEQHLLLVPAGDEIWKMNFLRFFYQFKLFTLPRDTIESTLRVISKSDAHLLVMPDSILSVSHTLGVGFTFDPVHRQYKTMLGIPASHSNGVGATVAVLDTGLDPQAGIATHSSSQVFSDDSTTASLDDTHGHGTVVASIIHDVAPGADLAVMKVGDGNPISEWNVLAALLAAGGFADIVNMSLAFGMPFRNCHVCGRGQTHSSRSAVFEQTVDELLRVRPELLLVAAAGNRHQGTLDFPARFGKVVAVGALDSQMSRPAYSNYGAVDQAGDSHDLVFFAPGGGNGEFLATTQAGQHEGTSFAAPYVSALMALHRSHSNPTPNRAAILTHFKSTAYTGFSGYTPTDFGNGLIQA